MLVQVLRKRWRHVGRGLLLVLTGQLVAVVVRGEPIQTVRQMIEARTDVWGDAAMRQPNGASYEFFENLLPPIRWVNTEFRHYPIVLSAPRSPQKSRLISNGSAVNARAKSPNVARPVRR